jgi:prevent-host-death family protein
MRGPRSNLAYFGYFIYYRHIMQNTRVSASEFQQAFGALSDKARAEPVVITKHGRDSLVVMSADEWERLKRRDRRVGQTQDLSDEWVDALQKAKA